MGKTGQEETGWDGRDGTGENGTRGMGLEERKRVERDGVGENGMGDKEKEEMGWERQDRREQVGMGEMGQEEQGRMEWDGSKQNRRKQDGIGGNGMGWERRDRREGDSSAACPAASPPSPRPGAAGCPQRAAGSHSPHGCCPAWAAPVPPRHWSDGAKAQPMLSVLGR